MRQLTASRSALAVGWLAALLTCGLAHAANELVVINLPERLAGVVQGLDESLRAGGLDVRWTGRHEAESGDRTPAVVVATAAAVRNAVSGGDLGGFVRRGGGLVLVISGEARDSRTALEALGVRAFSAAATDETAQWRPHAITDGLPAPGPVGASVTLSARDSEVLATVRSRAVAVVGNLGDGHYAVIWEGLLTGGSAGVGADLLLRTTRWVGGEQFGQSGGEPAVDAAEPPDLTGVALTDMASAKGRWPEVQRTVTEVLAGTGLRARPLSRGRASSPLARALDGGPELLVLGSHRAFDDAEATAFGQYVWYGGSALIVAYATADTVADLREINRLLAEVNLAVTFSRPAEIAIAARSPLTEGIIGWKRVPAGIAVWAPGREPLVTAGGQAVIATHEFGRGRIVVCDATALLPAEPVAPDDSSPAFRQLLARCLQWLRPAPADTAASGQP